MLARSGRFLLLACLPMLPAQPSRAEAPPTTKGRDLYGDPLPSGALARLGTERLRHGGPVSFVGFALGGKALVSSTSNGPLQVWELASGKKLCQVPTKRVWPMHSAISSDGKTLIGLDEDRRFRIWDLATGKQLRCLNAPLMQMGGAFWDGVPSPDGRVVALLQKNGSVLVWDVGQDRPRFELTGPADAEGGALAFAPDGQVLCAALGTKKAITLSFWDVGSGKELPRLAGPSPGGQEWAGGFPFSPNLSADGKLLTLGKANNAGTVVLHLLDRRTGREIRQYARGTSFRTVFSPDSTLLADGHGEGVDIVKATTGEVLHRLTDGAALNDRQVAFSPDGKTLAVSSADNMVRLWDVGSGRAVYPSPGHQGPVATVVWSADGRTLASAASDQTVRVWDAATGKELHRLVPDPRRDRRYHWDESPPVLAFTSGSELAAASTFSNVSRWDTITGKQLQRPVPRDGDPFQAAAFSPDCKALALAGFDGSLGLFAATSDRQVQRFPSPEQEAVRKPDDPFSTMAVALAHDGRSLARGGVGRFTSNDPCLYVEVCETATGKRRWHVAFHTEEGGWPLNSLRVGLSIKRLLFSPDDRLLAVSVDGMIHLWDLASRRELRRLKALQKNEISGLAFSPDGKFLAVGGNGEFYVSDVASGEEVARFGGHLGPVNTLAFSPDGTRLASGGADTTLLIWDVRRLAEAARRRRTAPTPRELDALWADLASDDGERADRALWALVAAPRVAVPLLRERLRPVSAVDGRRIARLIADLGDERYAARQRAMQELARLGDVVESALRRVLDGGPSLELRRRVEELLMKVSNPDAEQMRALRALEVLERIGSAEARQVLTELAAGTPEARRTREARASLERLERRSARAR